VEIAFGCAFSCNPSRPFPFRSGRDKRAKPLLVAASGAAAAVASREASSLKTKYGVASRARREARGLRYWYYWNSNPRGAEERKKWKTKARALLMVNGAAGVPPAASFVATRAWRCPPPPRTTGHWCCTGPKQFHFPHSAFRIRPQFVHNPQCAMPMPIGHALLILITYGAARWWLLAGGPSRPQTRT
jgi:hypothetical protein